MNSVDNLTDRIHGGEVNVDDVVETVSGFLTRLAARHPGLIAEMRKIEIDLDSEGVLKITTNVGVVMGALRPDTAQPSEPKPAVHVDVAVMAEWLGIDDSRWCHGTVDTDCLMQVLAEDSLGDQPGSGQLREVFQRLKVDPERLLVELRAARPARRGSHDFPTTVPSGDGGWIGQREPTGRFVLVVYRVLRSESFTSDDQVTAVEVLNSLLMEDQGPAAEALETLRVSPRSAREILGLPNARPVENGTMWPPDPHPREFGWPEGERWALPRFEAPPPSAHTTPSSFVWTSPSGHELELSAVRNGPIKIRARSGTETTVDIGAHTAEVLARHLMDFYHQLEAERWEPIFDSETNDRPKPPPPTPLT